MPTTTTLNRLPSFFHGLTIGLFHSYKKRTSPVKKTETVEVLTGPTGSGQEGCTKTKSVKTKPVKAKPVEPPKLDRYVFGLDFDRSAPHEHFDCLDAPDRLPSGSHYFMAFGPKDPDFCGFTGWSCARSFYVWAA